MTFDWTSIFLSGVHILDQHWPRRMSSGGRINSTTQEEEEAPPLVRALPQDTTQEGLRLASRVILLLI